ncbi:MAG: HNH endonuclease [Chitinophagales bacterium]
MRKSISKGVQASIYVRDKWCCRYCGYEIFFSPSLKALETLAPDKGYYHRNGNKEKMSKLLLDRCGCIDHIIPITEGGTNDTDNLICACWKCNTRKSNDTTQNWKRKIKNISDLKLANNWDGFIGILRKLDSDNEWLKYF